MQGYLCLNRYSAFRNRIFFYSILAVPISSLRIFLKLLTSNLFIYSQTFFELAFKSFIIKKHDALFHGTTQKPTIIKEW